jgi:hypothetical protein
MFVRLHDTRRDPRANGPTPRPANMAICSTSSAKVRFGVVDDVLAAGEGIETMLSLRYALPALPMAAALSANHLAAMMLPSGLRRLYIARDDDAAGDTVQAILTQRAVEAGVEAIPLSPRVGDFNEDLHIFGLEALRASLRLQLVPEDVVRLLHSSLATAE